MMKKEPNDSRVKDRVCQDDTATLLYSSGTTGASKGIVSSHRNLIAMVQTILGRFKLERQRVGEDRTRSSVRSPCFISTAWQRSRRDYWHLDRQ
uniref:AMP-dependent synthetase/ligase domain-containing protein n=1 Tax=Nelumbo nucifera TaxID=4432 RepID=A0A822XW92_NELNU|nr:TPA_asm: hypothetical protein HUJ06_023141 [Nelumbo nucifera]